VDYLLIRYFSLEFFNNNNNNNNERDDGNKNINLKEKKNLNFLKNTFEN
jgi:hypothetical protein